MKKLAIYVEGQTEQKFVSSLIKEIAGKNNLTIHLEKMHGGKKIPRSAIALSAKSNTGENEFYVLIRDCGGDSRVKSDIKDNIQKHAENGFCKVIGLLDVYPQDRANLPKLIMYSKTGMPTKYIPFSIIYTVMEIEAWFICESSHFSKFHSSLDIKLVEDSLGTPLSVDNIENIHQPAKVLNDIYSLVGMEYDKKSSTVDSVINCLDYERIYIELRENIKSLNLLIDDIDGFLI